MATKKATLVPKVWYAIEVYEDATEDPIVCYESLEEVIECMNDVDDKQKYYAYKIESLGEIELTRKIEYKFKK